MQGVPGRAAGVPGVLLPAHAAAVVPEQGASLSVALAARVGLLLPVLVRLRAACFQTCLHACCASIATAGRQHFHKASPCQEVCNMMPDWARFSAWHLERNIETLISQADNLQPRKVVPCTAQVYAKLESYEEDWAAGRVPGWEDRVEGPAANGATAAIDLEAFEAVEELETLGAPALPKRPVPRQAMLVTADECHCVYTVHTHTHTNSQCSSMQNRLAWRVLQKRSLGGVAHMPGRAGAERLKEALGALGLKTGGTLRQRA